MFFDKLAFAMGQAGGVADGQPGNPLMSFMPLILMFVIFYFLLIRPQQKKQKEHKSMLERLGRGDRVVTNGGLHGRVVEAKDNILTLDLGSNVQVQVERSFISVVVNAEPAKAKEKDKKKENA